MSELPGILDGIRVIDVGTFVFGPAAATVMSDFGAEVIKVENPSGGDPYRMLHRMPPLPAAKLDYCWLLDSRNKQSVALDLKRAEARAALLRLVATADVLVTNYQASVLADLHLRYEDVAPHNPRLVYAHATGYGERGPEAEKPGYDATAWWARSGLMDVVRAAGGEPALSAPGMGDHPSAMALFGAILLALFDRERTGRGARVSTSLLANGAWANSIYLQAILCGSEPFRHVERGRAPNALVNQYATRDGRWILLALVREESDWERFTDAIGRPDLRADPRFSTRPTRRESAADLVAILDRVFAARDFEEWRERLDSRGVTFGVVSRLDDLPNDAQAEAAGVFVDLDDERHGRMRTVASPISVAGRPKRAPGRAPEIGEHTDRVLASVGYSPEELRALRESGAIR
jgi:crotonobetainyl-CoA:carnitine CoA-transferase CaiB-like acyl-CoA transferase